MHCIPWGDLQVSITEKCTSKTVTNGLIDHFTILLVQLFLDNEAYENNNEFHRHKLKSLFLLLLSSQ